MTKRTLVSILHVVVICQIIFGMIMLVKSSDKLIEIHNDVIKNQKILTNGK